MYNCITYDFSIFPMLRYNKSVAQVLIRWSLQRGFVCIPKSVKEERIRENGDVFDFNISEDDMKAMVKSTNLYCLCWLCTV